MGTRVRTLDTMVISPNTGPPIKIEKEGDLITVYTQTKRKQWKESFAVTDTIFGILYAFGLTGQELDAYYTKHPDDPEGLRKVSAYDIGKVTRNMIKENKLPPVEFLTS